jgi:hypothetical protein
LVALDVWEAVEAVLPCVLVPDVVPIDEAVVVPFRTYTSSLLPFPQYSNAEPAQS